MPRLVSAANTSRDSPSKLADAVSKPSAASSTTTSLDVGVGDGFTPRNSVSTATPTSTADVLTTADPLLAPASVRVPASLSSLRPITPISEAIVPTSATLPAPTLPTSTSTRAPSSADDRAEASSVKGQHYMAGYKGDEVFIGHIQTTPVELVSITYYIIYYIFCSN